jgi:putative ABC transport system permease protein
VSAPGFSIAIRIARRELRGGLRGFRVFVVCLALGVAAIAAVGSVRSAISEGLSREGRAILGGDAEMRLAYRFASDEERAWMAANASAVSELVDFRSMATFTPPGGETERALTQVKGVDGLYPIYGVLKLADGQTLESALEFRDGVWGVVMARLLIERLGLKIGDRVSLGGGEYQLRAAIELEPDQASGGFGLGPRTIVLREALAASGLLAPGTLFTVHYRLKLPEKADLSALRARMETALPDSGFAWRDRRNGAPGLARFVNRIGAFLVLVGLASLAMGGVGVSSAVRTYLDGKTETIATLKTLGAEGRLIFAIYLLQIGALTMVGIALGLGLGVLIPTVIGPLFADQLPVPALFDVYAAPLVEAAAYGALTALIFALWPLAQAKDVRAGGLFRDAAASERRLPGPVVLVLIGALTVALVAIAVWFSGVWQLSLGFAGGVLGALLVLRFAAYLAARFCRWLARTRLARGRPALRLAFGAVGGPGGETAGVVLSLGLGLAVLAAVGQIDFNLRHVIDAELPAKAPAFFFIDVQNEQLDGFLDAARAGEGVTGIETAPMLRGFITRLDGVPADEARIDPAAGWVLRGDRGVSYGVAPPPGAVLTEGEWWPEDYHGEPLVSFSDEEGRELGLKIGSTVSVNILGRELTARVANFRVVEFRNMGINFLMILNPGALAGAPHTHIATVYAEDAVEGALLRRVASAFPNVTAIRVQDGIALVSSALADLAAATRWGALATLITGIVVLIGAAAAGERRRVYEAAVLKTIGATRARVLASFAIRSAILGAAAGLVAIIAGAIAGWAVMVLVMESDFAFEPVSAIVIVLAGAGASMVAGLLFAVRPLAARPAQVLRARD